jgi:hypothetical protein
MKQTEVVQNRETEHVRGVGQPEDRRRICERLKLGSGQAYERSSDLAVLVE